MTFNQAMAMLDFLNERFRRAGMTRRWWEWAINAPSWDKLKHWAERLGYEVKP